MMQKVQVLPLAHLVHHLLLRNSRIIESKFSYLWSWTCFNTSFCSSQFTKCKSNPTSTLQCIQDLDHSPIVRRRLQTPAHSNSMFVTHARNTLTHQPMSSSFSSINIRSSNSIPVNILIFSPIGLTSTHLLLAMEISCFLNDNRLYV